ncbi:hypothetical protein RJT34_25723 [Clitoria ternatea]|uniref:Prolyl endopeptidase n=1 Tax=Clitoria ternatea TaxID=43366 RepID=A0AAN9IIS6_CLITE
MQGSIQLKTTLGNHSHSFRSPLKYWQSSLHSPSSYRVVLSSALPFPSSAAAFSRHHHNAVSLPAAYFQAMVPPSAKKVEHVMEMFGDVRTDNYYWLRDDSRSDPEVLSFLREENAHTDSVMSETKELENKIFEEIKARIKKDDITAPSRRGPYYYYKKTLDRKEYVQHCRRLVPDNQKVPSVHDIMPTGPEAPKEHVILDENVKAQHHQYYRIDAFKVSPNHKLVAYAEDTKGNEIYTVYVIDAETQAPVGEPLVGVTSYLEWAGDNALVYITQDEILRPDKAWFHVLGTEQSKDTCLYVEKDNTFSISLYASKSKKYLFVASRSKKTRFNFYLDVSGPEEGLKVLTPRVEGIYTTVSHRGDHFFIQRRSDQFFNSEVVACAVNDTSSTTVLISHRESVKIQQIQVFSDHLVAYERENGLQKVIVYHLPPIGEPLRSLESGQAVSFIDPVYSVGSSGSEFSSSILRFTYSSLRSPSSVYDYDMKTGISVLKKSDLACIDPGFKSARLSLLDRGFVYAIAHVGGGGEMGRRWYENGKLLKKKNTFTDFIACAEYLIEKKFCSKERLCIEGRSAGGLLIGAVLNMRPDLFTTAVAGVPFVDVLTTMLDPTIPLTTSEWEEWGDPRMEEFYFYMKSYSPVDNVKAQNYPHILVTAGLNDPRVLYSEPAKFVAKLRDLKTDDNMLLFKCELGAGHFSKSGRFEKLQEEAFTYVFLLKALNMTSKL